MNTQPKHDLETGDLRESAEIVAMPNGINVGDLPNTSTATDDLRGHESSSVTDAETDNSRMFVGAAAVAALIGGLGIASYATGMWNAPPRAFAPRVAAIPAALPAQPVVAPAPPQAIVPAPPPVKVVLAPVVTPKRAAAPVVQARPKPAAMLPETTAPAANTTLTPEPLVPVQISPTPAEPALPELALPNLPSAPAPTPAQQPPPS